jgi:chemotaxis protein methyltransferase CheR
MKTLPIETVPKLKEAERQRISAFIESEFGIKMPDNKRTLLEGRLAKRVAMCGLPSYGAYFDFVTTDPQGRDEFLRFADLVSTHETSFFREAGHFDYLKRHALPKLVATTNGPLHVLSAACSTGEEVYTLAMVLEESLTELGASARGFTVEGVDLSDRAVGIAQRGVYLADKVKAVSPELARSFLMRSRDRNKSLHRVVPELRRKVVFHTGNLLTDPAYLRHAYDIIFCRNVLIYFDPANQRRVIRSLLARLKPEGLLFLGHSETMVSLDLPVKSVANAVYQSV